MHLSMQRTGLSVAPWQRYNEVHMPMVTSCTLGPHFEDAAVGARPRPHSIGPPHPCDGEQVANQPCRWGTCARCQYLQDVVLTVLEMSTSRRQGKRHVQAAAASLYGPTWDAAVAQPGERAPSRKHLYAAGSHRRAALSSVHWFCRSARSSQHVQPHQAGQQQGCAAADPGRQYAADAIQATH
jgi:hypothetical protein